MPTSYTSLLGLALPVTGELAGTWGDTVNDYLTKYLDAAVAGAQTISGSQTAVTLTTTNGSTLTQAGSGSTGSAQYQIINCTGNPASLLTITVPAQSKAYLVLNATSTSQSVKVVGAGPTTGVTMVSGERALIAWDGSDFVKVASSTADGVTTITFGTTGLTPSTATSGAVSVAGTLVAANGGTGQSSYTTGDLLYATGSTALSKLGIGTNGQILTSTGTAPQWSSPAALTKTDDTNVTLTLGGSASTALLNAASLTLGWTGQLGISRGGTNATATPTAGAVAYGTGTAYAFTLAGTSGQVLTSNGAGAPTWSSLSSIGVSTFSAGTTGFTPSTATSGAITLAGTLATTNGGTGLTSFTANRVFYASSTSAIAQSANLTFDGTTLTANALTTSSTVTINGGTANGVAYLNGSKVLTTGSALTFDGTTHTLNAASGYGVYRVNGSALGGGYLETYSSTGTRLGSFGSENGGDMYLGTRVNNPIIFLQNNAEQMRLTSTGLGIGTSSPGAKLDVTGGLDSTYNSNVLINSTASTAKLAFNPLGGFSSGIVGLNDGGIGFNAAGANTERMRLDSSGNLGLGVTPSAWTDYRALQVGSLGSIAFDGGSSMEMFSNVYYASGAFRYISSSASAKPTRYAQGNGLHYWYTAPSGTAGNAISFTQAMTLDASGNLGLGTTSPSLASGMGIAVYNSTVGGAARIALKNGSTGDASGDGFQLVASGVDAYIEQRENGFLAFTTNNTERARITSAGAWSFGSSGTATGTSGQVLTSNGSGSAPTWQTAGGGNWVLIQTNTFSGATTIDMTGMSSTYDLYFIEGVITGTTGSFFAPGWRLINSSSTVLTSSLYCGNLWGGEENTTNIRWYTDENAGRFLSSAAYYTTNIDISFNMYVNRSPNNEYQGVWGNTMSLYSTFPSPSWFSGGYRALVNLNGIRIFDTTSAWTATGTLRLWGWKKT